MLNCNVFSGHVISPPQLILVGENTPVTVFMLDLQVTEGSAGLITVVCYQPLAMAALTKLKHKEYVVIEGFIRRGKIPVGGEDYIQEVHLLAQEILKCQIVY